MKHKYKIGDFVQLKKHCKDRNRIAMVGKTAGHYGVFIAFVDSGEQYFSHSNDATTLGGDVCDYVAHVIHHERCATDIDHALRCTCERERIWDLRQEKIQANN